MNRNTFIHVMFNLEICEKQSQKFLILFYVTNTNVQRKCRKHFFPHVAEKLKTQSRVTSHTHFLTAKPINIFLPSFSAIFVNTCILSLFSNYVILYVKIIYVNFLHMLKFIPPENVKFSFFKCS